MIVVVSDLILQDVVWWRKHFEKSGHDEEIAEVDFMLEWLVGLSTWARGDQQGNLQSAFTPR